MLVPKLRFKREDGTEYSEWSLSEFGSFCKAIDIRTSDTETYPLYSLTIEDGVTPKTDRYVRDYLITKEGDSYKIVPNNAFVYNPMNLRFGALKANHSGKTVCVSGYYDVFEIGQPDTLFFWENYLTTSRMLNYYDRISTGSLIEKKRVYYSEFLKIKKSLPCLEEQQKIADFLSAVDEVIAQSEAEVQNLEQQKKAAMQKIFSQEVRFKREDGTDYPEWEEKEVRDCLVYEQPTKYIVKSEQYNDNYETPVLTANKGFILGYTNEKDGIYNKGDVIIYDDFTMDMKYVWFAFKVKSSAMKMLTAINDNNLYFMYSLLVSHNLHQEVHSRSYISQVEPMLVQIPCLEEQQKIADFLSAYDEAINYAKQELDKWKELKKGLLQQMFV